jgi:hypothetical protein
MELSRSYDPGSEFHRLTRVAFLDYFFNLILQH